MWTISLLYQANSPHLLCNSAYRDDWLFGLDAVSVSGAEWYVNVSLLNLWNAKLFPLLIILAVCKAQDHATGCVTLTVQTLIQIDLVRAQSGAQRSINSSCRFSFAVTESVYLVNEWGNAFSISEKTKTTYLYSLSMAQCFFYVKKICFIKNICF